MPVPKRCLAEVEAPEHAPTRIWFGTLLSYALTDAGDYERARAVVREDARGCRCQRRSLLAHASLLVERASRAAIQGRSVEALKSIREAIALLKTTDDSLHLARAYLMSAGIEAQANEIETARQHLGNAEQLLGPAPQPIDRAMLGSASRASPRSR